ncbi:MAG: hypothetical protein MUC36_20380 [Planctomycetes bacterium]|jgi:TolB protein|nr:hypothetical protein [Planctomycetota bacterium]
MPRLLPLSWPSCGPLFLGLAAAACSSGGSSTPIGGATVPPELVACRGRIDSPFQFAEIAARSARNLGNNRVADRAGIERDVRLHPDANRLVFARQRDNGDPDSTELFVSSLDGALPELRLTQNGDPDGDPCWSPDGSRVLFAATRSGAQTLWTIAADGSDAQPLGITPNGYADSDPDWSRATDRIVWSRRDPDGKHTLWLAFGNGNGAGPLTDGGSTTGAGNGDLQPSFSPDGQQVAFVRRSAAGLASLCVCNIATFTVTTRLQPIGDVGWPRFAPAQDRLWFGLAEPAAGRLTMRLCSLSIASGEPVLAWPDERWQLQGLDLLPTLPAAPAAAPAAVVDLERATVQLAAGSSISGTKLRLAAADDDAIAITTETFEGREIAGISMRYTLPVTAPTDVLELRIRAVARSSRVGGDSALRMSIYNPVDERFDTAVELAPAGTGAQTMVFTSSSLRHLTSEKQLRVTVVADLPAGVRATLEVDQFEVVLVARAN